MSVREYVGARYVPKFADPVEWQKDTSYEALTIVTYNNSSYTSKIPVPSTVGNPANNGDYWALTGNYSAQVQEAISKSFGAIIDVQNPGSTTGLARCVCDKITDDYAALQAIVDYAAKNNYIVMLTGVCYISQPINITKPVTILGTGTFTGDGNLDESVNDETVISGIKCKSDGFLMNSTQSCVFENFCVYRSVDGINNGFVFNRNKYCKFDNIAVSGFWCAFNVALTDEPSYKHNNFMFNSFFNITCNNNTYGVRMVSNNINNNACHNLFVKCQMRSADSSLDLGWCDNNTFIDVWTGGGNFGLTLRGIDSENAGEAASNYFYHFQGSVVNNALSSSNFIYDFDRENGQGIPIDNSPNQVLCYNTSDGIIKKHGSLIIFGDNQKDMINRMVVTKAGFKFDKGFNSETSQIGYVYTAVGDYGESNWTPYYNGTSHTAY